MSFEKLMGNEEVKKILNKIIQTGNVTHSYLLIGPTGIGKTLFAEEFAKMILCEGKQDKPCCQCQSCIEFENNNQPDFIKIAPEAGNIKIETIRQMQEKVLEKPIISSKKVYLIKDADCMTKEAGNCLLKTLEEPPNFITILMTGSNESMFLNTIKSRCTKISFHKIEEEIISQYAKKKGMNLEENLLKACEGSFEKLAKVYEKKEEYQKIQEIFANIEDYQLLDAMAKLDFFYHSKEEIQEILDYINIILQKKAVKNPKYINYIETIEQTKKRLRSNSNYDMSIDNMFYSIWEE